MKNKIVEFKDLKIPEKFIGNFEGFDDLELSNYEKEILRDLRQYSDAYGVEAIKVIYDDGETDLKTSNEFGRVIIPIDTYMKKHIKIYHSHTDISALSQKDLEKLSNPNIDKIAVINYACYIYVAIVDDSVRPDKNEIATVYNYFRNQVAIEIVNGKYGKMNTPENNYVLIMETMFRVCRHYKWKIEGGNFNE